MQPPSYHDLLKGQIREAGVDISNLPAPIQALLQKISNTYSQVDEAKNILAREVKHRTDQLMASTSSAYSFMDSLNMGFIMCDVSAEVVLTNEAVKNILSQKMSGSEAAKTVTVTNTDWTLSYIDGLLKPDFNLKESIQKSLETSEPQEIKEANFGKRVLHLFIAPMVNELSSGQKEQIGAVILVEDITEQKVLERSKDEFLSIASHELRTPLTAIRGNASLIKKYYGDRLPNKDTVEMIDDIHESAIRLIDIVNDFLDASSLEQGKMQMDPESFSLHEVVSSVIRELHTIADIKHIQMIIDPSLEAAPPVTADKQRIMQVVYNLIGNAVKFTESGNITIAAKYNDEFVDTSVADTGKGMSAENQRLLFRKFQQADNSLLSRDNTQGTGLGLFISKLIIERSGGTIALEASELNRGSTFVFSLPRIKNTVEQSTPNMNPVPTSE